MNTDEKRTLIERCIEIAAETVGDITRPVIEHYYRNYPGIAPIFDELSYGEPEQLEGSMVETTLYCLMMWYERPVEIRTMLAETVPHHSHTLNVPLDAQVGFLESVVAIIAGSLPVTASAERNALEELRDELVITMNRC